MHLCHTCQKSSRFRGAYSNAARSQGPGVQAGYRAVSEARGKMDCSLSYLSMYYSPVDSMFEWSENVAVHAIAHMYIIHTKSCITYYYGQGLCKLTYLVTNVCYTYLQHNK